MIVWTIYVDGEEGSTCQDTDSVICEMERHAKEEDYAISEMGWQKFRELLDVLQPGEKASYGIWQVQCHEMTQEEWDALPYWHCH